MGETRRDNDIIIGEIAGRPNAVICISYSRAFPLGGDRSRIFFRTFKTTQNKCPSKDPTGPLIVHRR